MRLPDALLLTLIASILDPQPVIAQCEWAWRNEDFGANNSIMQMTQLDPDGAGPATELFLVGGWITEFAGIPVNRIAAWDGSNWFDMGEPDFVAFSQNATDFVVFRDRLYCAAIGLYEWTGAEWDYVESAPFPIYGLLVHDDNLVVHGPLTRCIKRWDGQFWFDYGTGMSEGYLGDDPSVDDVAIYNGELYAGGNFNRADGKQCTTVVRWDGTTWQSLPGAPEPRTSALHVFDDKLYAGGLSRLPWYSPFAYWDGAAWTYPEQPDSDVYALHTFNGQLALGGGFELPYEGVALWDGANYSGLAGGIESFAQAVFALAEFDGALYAGGNFREVDGMPIEYFAIWEQVPAGDIFGNDGAIDISDLGVLLSAFNACPGDAAYDDLAGTLADDGNDCVNLGDLGVVLANWGQTCE